MLIRNLIIAAFLTTLISSPVTAEDKKQRQVLFTNVNIFDGVSAKLVMNGSVLVEGNLIKRISGDTIDAPDAYTVDGEGRTLMPGLIDMHAHMCIYNGLSFFRDPYDAQTVGAYTHQTGLDYLQQGFTTTRSAGCNDLGIAKGINNGIIAGPRWFPAGGFLSQTGGHADLGTWSDEPLQQDSLERAEMMYIVDGKTEARRAARSNFRRGATHIKIMGGGGVSSAFDPLHTTQFSIEEMQAVVGVAEDYGSYVTVHAYHDRSINRAIDAGVRMLEHGFLMSEKTMDRMVAEGIVLNVQAQASLETFGDVESITFFTADQKAKGAAVNKGATQMLKWAVEKGVTMVLGGDMFGPDHNRQADNLIWFNTIANNPLLTLQSSTSTSGRILAEMSGEMNPYKDGALGVIEEGAYADIILVDGNPLEDLEAVKRDRVNFVMKDGLVYKNWLPGENAPAFQPAGPKRNAYFGNL
ncbi:MAG: amidohydrolase family protein [Hyphomicrobiales bacterium]|nr:amidohydrolase family protein [Hyphomicrobiales bacterium]